MLKALIAAPLFLGALALPASRSLESSSLHLCALSHPACVRALASSCATYHGIVGTEDRQAIFHSHAGCSVQVSAGVEVHSAGWEWGKGELVWAGMTGVDETVAELVSRRDELDSAFVQFAAGGEGAYRAEPGQMRFAGADEVVPRLVVDIDQTQQLWHFASDASLELWTSHESTALRTLVALSSSPQPLPSSFLAQSLATSDEPIRANGGETVPAKDVARIVDHLDELKFQPLISLLLSKVPIDEIEEDVLYLSGESQPGVNAGEGWVSRHSMSEGGHRASDWLLSRFSAYGFNCSQHSYKLGFAPMVECVLEGVDKPEELVVIGGHFDSRGSFGYPKAPGADDDGSGTSILLALAREISRNSLSFSRTVVIAAFSGEEQGLLGSKWYSQRLRDANKDVVLMVQNDMLAYRKPGEPLQLGFPDLIGLDEAKWLLGNVSILYAPELVVGETPACCSDHQYFDQLGFASTWIFERNGPIADPMYHNSGDLVQREGYSLEQVHAAHSVIYATVLEVAGFNMAG